MVRLELASPLLRLTKVSEWVWQCILMYFVAKAILLNSVDTPGPPVNSRKEQQYYMSGFCSDECAALDLDGHGGRTFLRVLLHLTMHDYPPLVSGALHLLFRHFSQRQEVLQAFKQVVIARHKHYLFIKRLNLMRLYCNSLWIKVGLWKNQVAVGLWLEAEKRMQV